MGADLSSPPPASLSRHAADGGSFGERLSLGVGSLAAFFGYTGIAALAVPVYQMTFGVDPVLLGLALALPRVWEAFLDPVMGNVSDNFRSRWGRRRPFIVGGAVTMGMIYGLIWMVPPAWSESAKLAYLTLTSFVFFTAYTVFSVPYASLTYELARDHHERTRVMAHCSFFHKLSELGYQWIFPLSQLALFVTALQGVRIVGWGTGVVLLAIAGMLPGLLVRERFQATAARRQRVPFWASVRAALALKAFRVVLGLVLINVGMGMLTSNLDHYVLVYYVANGDVAAGSVWKGVLTSGYAIVGIATIPLVVWTSRRIGKHATLALAYGLSSLGGLLKWFTFSSAHPWLVIVDPLLCGPMWVASFVLFSSMIADICDEDELHSGQRREGTYGALFAWIQKTAVSVSFMGSAFLLNLSGFRQELGGAQSEGTLVAMRGLLAASAALPPLLALVLLRFYPLDAASAADTCRILEQRRRRAEEIPTAVHT